MTGYRMPRYCVVGVGAIVTRPDGRILIGHRIRRGESPSWCFPGGHVETGESFEAAASREIAEETGIHIKARAEVFSVTLNKQSDAVQITAGVIVPLLEQDIHPQITELHVFDQWIWANQNALPAPLFPATAAILAAWRDEPLPVGWTSYHVSGNSKETP
jgi:8-oxo-dGTP diphosphatase